MKILRLTCLTGLLLIGILSAAAPGLAQQPPPQQSPPTLPFVPGEILVKFRSGMGISGAQTVLQSAGTQLKNISSYSGVMQVQVAPGGEAEAIAALAARPEVAFAELNYILTALGPPNDPDFSKQWSLHNTGQTGGAPDADIDAPEAWDLNTGSSQTIIAILDTGIDLDHEDLQAKIWVNPGEIPANGLDDDGNGFIDDVKGWDFCNSSGCSGQDNNPDDEQSHGTHVAGIAGAAGNNGLGIAGVSWGSTLMAVKVLNQSKSGTVSSVANGINYAVANGADVINMSLGASGSQPPCSFEAIRLAMADALNNNVLVVVAAGNDNQLGVNCPAAYDEAMAVGSTTDQDSRSYFSNYGNELDIAAPGSNIYSTIPGSYGPKSGTSMATPHVAGLAALLWSFRPDLLQTDVRSTIEATADDLGLPDWPGWDRYFGYGRVNARRGLEALVSLQTSPLQLSFLVDDSSGPFPAMADIQIISANSENITWSATISPGASWLDWGNAPSGIVSVATSPVAVTLVPDRPATPGQYSTTVIITGTDQAGQSLGTRSIPVQLSYVKELQRIYLPSILKKAVSAPDLIIENLVATSQAVTVTLKNQGNSPVTEGFWVDVYFDPSQTPGLNQPWNSIANHGLVWGVTTSIPPAGTLILTTGGDYYSAENSSSPPWPVAVQVYGLVDSINYETTYGAVKEQNESNNLFGPVTSMAGLEDGTIPADTRDQSSNQEKGAVGKLPRR